MFFNLTKRQILCFGGGALIGVPLFFLLGLYEQNGQPLEKVAGNIVRACFLRPGERPYLTQNAYREVAVQYECIR